MYLLDTDGVSELRKGRTGKGHRNVSAWAKSVSVSTLFLSAISILKLEIGILLIERRDARKAQFFEPGCKIMYCPHLMDASFLSIRPSRRDAPCFMSQPLVPIETR